MQFDKFDNKAREAAENHHPPYNEQAWAKMEKLLDKHMPQEEDDRRRVLFFLLLIIGLGGAGLFIAKPWKGKQTRAAATQSVQQVQAMQQALTSKTGKEAKGINKTVVKESDKVITSIVPTVNSKPVINPYLPNQHDDKFNNKTQRKSRLKPQPVIITNSVNSSIENDKPTADVFTNSEKEKSLTVVEFDKQLTTPPVTKNSDQINGAAVKENDTIEIASTNIPTVANSDRNSVKENLKTVEEAKGNQPAVLPTIKISKTKKGNTFFFTLSTGPDVSFVQNNKFGTSKFFAGVGMGYTFNNRITIRGGFYSGRKIYTASPDSYNPPPIFYTYYPYLEKVAANCKVYEIPLSVSYSFRHTPKHEWFASVGVSSLIMKKETYNYFYKYTATGPTINRERTIANQNEHLFSTLTLSGGYQHTITKNITIMAEPYFKIPLNGIGYGKVKLNSGGVLFSIAIRPFDAKKKK